MLALRPPRFSHVALVALTLACLQLATRAWVGFSGFFNLDDYVFYTRAASMPLWSKDFLLESYNAHVMPGSMVWVWLSTHAAPLGFAPVMVVSLILQSAIDIAMFMVLKRMFGSRPAILVPYALFVFTTLTLPGMVWWAAGLNQLPQQLFTLLALLAHIRYLRTERLRDSLLSVAAVVGGLAFSEKSALAVPLIFAITWLFFVGGSLGRGLLLTLKRYRTAWIGYAAVGIPYAAYYFTQVEGPVHRGVTASQIVELVDVVVRRTVVPGLVGGPWRWEPIGWVDSLADPHPMAQVVALVIVVATLAYSTLLTKAAWRAWALAGAALAAEIGLLVLTRVQVVGVEAVGAEYRYFTDFAMVAALALGLAFLTVTAPTRSSSPPPKPAEPEQPAPPFLATIHLPTVSALAIVGLALSSVYSATTYRDRWSENPGKTYFANAIAALDVPHETQVVLYDGPVPTAVVWRLLWPATLPSSLFDPRVTAFTTLQEGDSTPALQDIGADGHLRSSNVQGISTRAPAVKPCGWKVHDKAVTLPLESSAFYWNWIVEITYTADHDGVLTLTAGDTTADVPFAAGASSVYVAVTGEMASIDVTTAATDSVCIDHAVVGLPQPVEW